MLEREGNLLAGYNDNTNSWKHAWVRTHFGPNVRLHDYAGDVGDVWTNQHGWARIAVPPNGYVMYGRDGFQGKQPNPPVRRTVQEFEAEKDMDMRPAGEWWSEATPFTSEKNEPPAQSSCCDAASKPPGQAPPGARAAPERSRPWVLRPRVRCAAATRRAGSTSTARRPPTRAAGGPTLRAA
mgnify:CR=1 FL=1